MNTNDIPIWQKYTLSIEEASRYFRIGEKKLRRLAKEILDVGVALTEMEVQVVSAIGTDQKAGEHIAFPLMGAALADLAPLLLDLLKDCPLNDRFVDIFEYHPILPVILQSLFILVRLGVGLKVQNVAAILLQGQYFCDAGTVPLRRWLFFPFAGPLNAFFEPIGARCQNTILFKTCSNLLRSIALQGHTVVLRRYGNVDGAALTGKQKFLSSRQRRLA